METQNDLPKEDTKEIKDKELPVFEQFVLSQPEAVQNAFNAATALAIEEMVRLKKRPEYDEEVNETVKSTLVRSFYTIYDELKKNGLIPYGFDYDRFANNFKTWAAFLKKKDLLQAAIDLTHAMTKSRNEREAWQADPDLEKSYLLSTARTLFEKGDFALESFLKGNKRANFFSKSEIETIVSEVERLKSK